MNLLPRIMYNYVVFVFVGKHFRMWSIGQDYAQYHTDIIRSLVDWPGFRTIPYGDYPFFSRAIRIWNSLSAEVVFFFLAFKGYKNGIKYSNFITDVHK